MTTERTLPKSGAAPHRVLQPRDESVLSATNLVKRFGDLTAVDGVTFHIAPGETYGLLGPNGAGKTTTISMVAGLLESDAGAVELLGEHITPRTVAAKAAIGLVPQDIAVYPDLTARENLSFFGRLYGLAGDELSGRIAEVLEVVGLADRADDRTDEYSGGMKRRLNIGLGLLHRPRLLILDEPTVGVDPQSRNAILEGVEKLSVEGMSVLYTTHYMEEAERICDRVGIMDEGRMIAEGTRRELVALVGEHDRIRLAATGDLRAASAAALELDRVVEATAATGAIDLIAVEGRSLLPALLDTLERHGASVSSVEVIEPDLEAVFLHLTGKALRD